MKKVLLALIISAISTVGFAQEIRMGGNYGYMFGGGSSFYYNNSYNDFKIIASEFGMLYLRVMPSDDVSAGFSYTSQDSEVRMQRALGGREYIPLKVQYYNLDFSRHVEVSDIVEPFGSFGLGLVVFNPYGNTYKNSERMDFTLAGGINILASERLGIKLQARMLMPVYFAGAGFYFGSGGSGVSLNSGSVLVQGEVSGGIFLRLGND